MTRDALYAAYEQELNFIRRMAAGFADKYPAVAGRLLLEPTRCQDPHIERLIEAYALLAARVHLRLNEGFPEITDALLGILYPHYLMPVPALTIAQFELDPQGGTENGVRIERESILHSRRVKDVACRFTTKYGVTLWPIEVTAASVEPLSPSVSTPAQAALRIALRTRGNESLSGYSLDRLTFFLDGDPSVINAVYEVLFRDAVGLMVRRTGAKTARTIEACNIRAVGFESDEGILAYGNTSLPGYRILHEYFCFPEKFLFVEFSGLDQVADDGDPATLEILVPVCRPLVELDGKLRPQNFKLGCTPAVNLFPHHASPIRVDHRTVDYQIVPEPRTPLFYEVCAVSEVATTLVGTGKAQVFRPFYDLHHGSGRAEDNAFWHATRRPSMRKDDDGEEVFLSLVDPSFQPTKPTGVEVLHVRALCSNRDLPAQLKFSGQREDFQVEGRPEVIGVRCLRQPTKSLRPSLSDESRWRLISHLTLNHLSMAPILSEEGYETEKTADKSLDALREILRLYDPIASAATSQRIRGLVGIRARRVTRVLTGIGPLRGLQMELELDETHFAGDSALLFASVLERFLSLYASINSFTETVVRTRQREEPLKAWPPATGVRSSP